MRGSTAPIVVPPTCASSSSPSTTSSTASPGESGRDAGAARLMRRARPVLPISSMNSVAGALSVRPLPFLFGLSAAISRRSRSTLRCAMRFVASRSRACSYASSASRSIVQLGERLAEAVVGIDVGTELEELAVRLDRLLPLAARGVRDGLLAELASLSGRWNRLLQAP